MAQKRKYFAVDGTAIQEKIEFGILVVDEEFIEKVNEEQKLTSSERKILSSNVHLTNSFTFISEIEVSDNEMLKEIKKYVDKERRKEGGVFTILEITDIVEKHNEEVIEETLKVIGITDDDYVIICENTFYFTTQSESDYIESYGISTSEIE